MEADTFLKKDPTTECIMQQSASYSRMTVNNELISGG